VTLAASLTVRADALDPFRARERRAETGVLVGDDGLDDGAG
jgi:hypothetical protein